jgi:hypothetical protein
MDAHRALMTTTPSPVAVLQLVGLYISLSVKMISGGIRTSNRWEFGRCAPASPHLPLTNVAEGDENDENAKATPCHTETETVILKIVLNFVY